VKRLSALLARFWEALAWFRRRLPIRKEEWEELEARAQRRAFTVAEVANLDVINGVWKALDRSIEKGEDFAKFKKRVSKALTEEWGQPRPGRVENIFRTNVQMAYQAGRWRQAQVPAIQAAKPYGMLSTIVDESSSEWCGAKLNRVVLPLRHPWFKTNWPPRHYQCRTTVILLTERQATAIGITANPPNVPPQQGFGLIPTAEEWAPDVSDYPAPLRYAYRTRSR
jgi:hypothetical protein